jgi:hypothetical protein
MYLANILLILPYVAWVYGKETVINLSDQKLYEPVYSLLQQKGLNFALTPRSTPTVDILAGVEKSVLSLPVEMAVEARQETVRIIKNTSRPRDNLSKTERAALKTIKSTETLPFYQQTKEMPQWYSTPQTTNRRLPLL